MVKVRKFYKQASSYLAMERRKRGVDILGREICTKEDFIRSFRSQRKGEKTASLLDEHDIFPLTYGNPKLACLNTLGLYVYFSGALTLNGKNQFDASVAGGRPHQRDLSSLTESELGLKLQPREKKMKSGENSYCWYFGENAGPYARLLSFMDVHTSYGNAECIQRKARTGSVLPHYLVYAIDRYENLSKESKDVCKSLLTDFVTVCIDTKGSVQKWGKHQALNLELLTQPSHNLVYQQGLQILGAISIAYPEIVIKGDELFVSRIKSGKSKGKYDGYIRILADQIPNSLNMPSLEIRMHLTPACYSFER